MSAKQFAHRVAVCLALVFSVAVLGLGRLATVASDAGAEKNTSNCTTLRLCRIRGSIYDTNMNYITNSRVSTAAVFYPTDTAVTYAKQYVDEDREKVLSRLAGGRAAVAFVTKKIPCDGVTFFEVRRNGTENLASHIVGYVDGDGIGRSGLQAAYDEIMGKAGEITVKVPITATGTPIYGVDVDINYNNSKQNDGVITTIDTRIQRIVEEAASSIDRGSILVTEVGTGKIRAMVSRPDYDATKISEYLDDKSSPLINRALSAYNVGSVFKPCIAAAALENGVTVERVFNCVGNYNVCGRDFKCNNLSGHGVLDMRGALGKSCNCYFYSLAISVGAEKLYKTASAFPFGKSIRLADGIMAAKGVLTSKKSLMLTDSAVANFAIGQGDLLLSPIAMSTVYEAIASGGLYHTPTLVEGTVENGRIIKSAKQTAPTRVFSENTANILREYLTDALTDGTGSRAKPDKTTAAGKTATAETGWKDNGNPVTHGWFCGFFPADSPKYTVTVMCEGASSGGKVCAPVFKQIADKCSVY